MKETSSAQRDTSGKANELNARKARRAAESNLASDQLQFINRDAARSLQTANRY